MHRWSRGRGMSVVVRPDVVPLASIQQRLSVPIAAAEAQLLDLASEACRPTKLNEVAPAAPAGPGLEWALHQGRVAVQAAPSHGSAEVPSVRKETLDGLEEQNKVYRDNNHVLYKEDFFDNATWNAITDEVKRLW